MLIFSVLFQFQLMYPKVLTSSLSILQIHAILCQYELWVCCLLQITYIQMDKFEEPSQNTKASDAYVEKDLGEQFKRGRVIGKGTFGIVYLALWKGQSEVALKHVPINPKYKNRQVEILSKIQHPNIVKLICHFQSKEGDKNYSNLVMEYMPITLSQIIKEGGFKNRKIDINQVIRYAKGMLKALAYLDQFSICHRDIKPSNILVDKEQYGVKVCDFGSAKKLKKGQKSIVYICSRYYRAPELIFECVQYSTKIDVWSVGCVIAELLIGRPIFDGANSMDQLLKIIKVLGTPSKNDLIGMKIPQKNRQILVQNEGISLDVKIKKYLPSCPEEMTNFLKKLLTYNPQKRLSARQALECEYLNQE